jgi:HD-GYP domain-containing protein (c-di-GMP phosphodiesterase class II)
LNVAARGFSRRLADSLQAPDSREDPLQLLDSMVEMLNRTDSFMAGHSQRVSDLSASIARLAKFSATDIEFVRRAGLVHDIGKVSIPEKVLRKSEPLTADEMHLIKLHPIFGASLLSRLPGMDSLVPVVLHHHERWDGSGYPGGLSMTDIPKEARVIAVADAYDAMTSYRPYGEVLSAEEALNELRRCSGTQFDPSLVDAMHEAFLYGLLERKTSVMYPRVEHKV